MEQGEIRLVPLGRIRPSVDNPRRDFGDLDELAESFAATGGEPFNPIACYADGDFWRIADGERRYRALKTLYPDEREVRVLAFRDSSAAHEVVAMLATDDKLRLSEQERAQGFQTALALGVDEQDVARVMHRSVGDVRKARSVADSAPEQATFDQMVAAAEFEGPDREKVFKAGPLAWKETADSIRKRKEDERQRKILDAAIDDLELGGVVVRFDERPDGYRAFAQVTNVEDLDEAITACGGEEVAVWPCSWSERYVVVGVKAPEPEPETPEDREARELQERIDAAFRDVRRRLVKDVASCDMWPELQAAVGIGRDDSNDWQQRALKSRLKGLGVVDRCVDELMRSEASMYEVVRELDESTMRWHEWVLAYLPPVIPPEGYIAEWDMRDEDLWLLKQAEAARADLDAKGADE